MIGRPVALPAISAVKKCHPVGRMLDSGCSMVDHFFSELTGTKSIEHTGHLPFCRARICGCIGQVHVPSGIIGCTGIGVGCIRRASRARFLVSSTLL